MLKLYNTLSKKKEVFKPLKQKQVKLFVCGPTVYDSAHLGHARTYLAFDMIAKYLKEKDYNVFYLVNITDIDDKIIQRAEEKGVSPQKLARKYEKAYLQDMKALKIDSVSKYARATDHVKEIISQAQRLLKKGYAYQIEDGVYYNVTKFKDYGKLSRRSAAGAEHAVSRIDEAKGKKNKGDFCLWKLSKPGEPKWPSIFGPGRPGWHIEDTAMAEKYLGVQYDIHGGANELIFPHHEAEIAQMEAISQKKPFVRYWLHTGLLTIDGKKMSKSLNNFITIEDFLKKHSPRLLRLLVLKSHYRSLVDYNEKSVVQAEKELERIDEFTAKLRLVEIGFQQSLLKSDFNKRFEAALEDDFNTPQAMAVIFELINRGNALIAQNNLSQKEAKGILIFFKEIDQFLNFIFPARIKQSIPAEVLSLVKGREKCRKNQDWQQADALRQRIKELGWQVEDTPSGPKLKRI